MTYKVIVEDSDGEEIELVSTDDPKFCEGARFGAESLLNLFYDEMELEEGYKIITRKDENEKNHSSTKNVPFSQKFYNN